MRENIIGKELLWCAFVLICGIIMGIIIAHLQFRHDYTCTDIIEGYQTECFDSKGVDWLSIYPVNYIDSRPLHDEFTHAQLCYSEETKRKYRLCIEELK